MRGARSAVTRGKAPVRLGCGVSVLLCTFAAQAISAARDDVGDIRRMVDAGAAELALVRIEALQPADIVSASWSEWEALRCEVLGRLRRPRDILERMRAFPAAAGASALNACFVEGARAALGQNEPEQARAYAARVLWERNVTPSQAKSARLTVIESYIVEGRADDTFRSMLRFQQDYQPLERAVAGRFAEAMLDLGRDREALNWVGAGNDISPARLRLQLRAGTLSPEAVIKQARAALARNPDPGYWRAILDAAARSRSLSLQIEALERLLVAADPAEVTASTKAAQRLWLGYADVAGEIGNREQLLMGDDGAWADYAARRLGSDPFLSRAFYGFLAQHAQNADIQRTAQLQLSHSLASANLDYAALRLIGLRGFELETLDAQTRYLLGSLAAKRNEARLALKLWQGLAPPPAGNPVEWQLTLARTALQAGDADTSAAAMKRLLSGRTAVSAELAQSVLELAQEMLDVRKLDAALSVYELLVPLASEPRAREALFGLARAQELNGEPVAAAGAYLRSALLAQPGAPDALAFQARLLAGLNLMRGGLKADARAQFEWLLKNSREPALTEAARRALSRL